MIVVPGGVAGHHCCHSVTDKAKVDVIITSIGFYCCCSRLNTKKHERRKGDIKRQTRSVKTGFKTRVQDNFISEIDLKKRREGENLKFVFESLKGYVMLC